MQTSWNWLAAGGAIAGAMRNLSFRTLLAKGERFAADTFRDVATRITPRRASTDDGDESLDVWGFADSQFKITDDGQVQMTGKRYALSGHKLPALLPWVQGVMEVVIDPKDIHASNYPPAVPAPLENVAFENALRSFLDADQLSNEPLVRLRHGHGHTQEEMYNIKYGEPGRLPDLVVFPTSEQQVSALVGAAAEHNACLIPFGGGTSVTEALRCPDNEQRFIVSVDMKRMNRVLWVDPINRMACIEAGAVGRHIMATLEAQGFTMGHEPYSVEFSTLGGWIATHASGMKKNKYGNIEELVLDVNMVTAAGLIKRTAVAPRESIGADTKRWIFGSEGNFGIITSAVVKLFPKPEAQAYGSVLFPSLEQGVSFLYDLQMANAAPASVRLVDNLQFQFGLALKPAATSDVRVLKSKLEKLYVTKLRGFDPDRMTACTLVFEGTAEEVARQEETVYRIAAQHAGMKAGSENGERGYQLTYGIAYIRDFVMNHYVLAESFETSVPWSRVLELCDNVKKRIYREHAARNLPGKPFISCRVTQVYPTGVAVYFYFAFYYKGLAHPTDVYNEIEAAARDEILRSGGSLSHHHGIGKIRQRFLPDIMSPAALTWARRTKEAVDPQNIFGARNQSSNDIHPLRTR